MKLAIRWNRVAVSVLVLGGLAAFLVAFSGCPKAPMESGFPATKETAEPAVEETVEPAAEETTEPKSNQTAQPGGEETAEPPTKEAAEPATKETAEPEGESATAAVDPSRVSTFAPAEDLVSQLDEYLEELEGVVQSEEEYNEWKDKLAKDSNTLVLIALALGLHDTDNKYKAAAPAMVKAAQQVAAAEDYASAKVGVDAVKAATTSTAGDPSELKWEKVASLKQLMEAVPLIDSRLKRYIRKGREERAKKAAEELAGYSAVLAVIAQGSIPNSDETESPDEVEKWQQFCVRMRDAAAAFNQRIRAFDQEGTTSAFEAVVAVIKDLDQSCDDCHEVFHPEEVKQ